MDADSKDKKRQMPLSLAAVGGHEAVVKLLLARVDVDADSKDKKRQTPLGHEAVVKLLSAREDVYTSSITREVRRHFRAAARGTRLL